MDHLICATFDCLMAWQSLLGKAINQRIDVIDNVLTVLWGVGVDERRVALKPCNRLLHQFFFVGDSCLTLALLKNTLLGDLELIRARHKRRFKATTDSKHALPVAPNLLDRDFTPAAPNQVWTADMTYIWTDEGWLYLAVVLDLFNREVVGWSIKPRMTADIVVDALTMAGFRRKPAAGLLHHSDRGSQYASHAFQARLKEYEMICSMSRKGNCWDNAPSESFFNSLKNERVHGTRYCRRAEAIADIFDYIEPFYNRKRLHSTLGYASPAKFLEDWISTQHEQQLAA